MSDKKKTTLEQFVELRDAYVSFVETLVEIVS